MEYISLLSGQFPLIGLFLLLILGAIGLPFPEDATLILCGYLISHGVIPPFRALIMVYAGLLIADTIIYHIGKKYGRLIVTHRWFCRFLSPQKLQSLEKMFNRRGILIILFGRQVIGLRGQIFLVAGIMRMRYLKFILTDAVSALGTITLMVGIGYAGGNSLEHIQKDMESMAHWVIVIALTVVTIYLIIKYFRSRRELSH
ncbi:MAG: DedA family protein [Nitrospirae bacterium]|nr:DedA family protein [Nitrospirota bacterium]